MTFIHIIREIVLIPVALIGTYVLVSITYCLLLLVVACISGVTGIAKLSSRTTPYKFCIFVPAHNEELVIGATLESLTSLNYPSEFYRVVVIADNCTDRTAEFAAKFKGVVVLQRTNPFERGKGYALNWALAELQDSKNWDSIVVVDADTIVDQNFLVEMNLLKNTSTARYFVAQGRYDVLNGEESWRTALLAGAFSLVHVVRPKARHFLHFTVGLKGNGMCFDRAVLDLVPWRGDSLTEDIEHALDLLEKHDVRVQFAPQARIAALMPATESAATSQRERWENGRSQIVKRRAVALLLKGFTSFRPAYIDAAVDLLIPPLAEMAAAMAVWFVLMGIYLGLGGSGHLMGPLAVYAAGAFVLYILVGFAVGGAPAKAFSALLYAPVYTVWKVVLRIAKPAANTTQWVRTQRVSSATGQDPVESEPVAEVSEK